MYIAFLLVYKTPKQMIIIIIILFFFRDYMYMRYFFILLTKAPLSILHMSIYQMMHLMGSGINMDDDASAPNSNNNKNNNEATPVSCSIQM